MAPSNLHAAPGPSTGAESTSTGTGSDPGQPRWIPALDTPWQWELDHPLDVSNRGDMGTGVAAYQGRPAANPVMYDIDGFENSAATIASLHARGDRVVCYVETGALEKHRPDESKFPASVLGKQVDGYPDERYLDIRSPAVVRAIEARIAMCAGKGFDAVEPDIDDSYTDDTGFPLTEGEEISFDTTIAAYAHDRGLSIALKNGDSFSFAQAMRPMVDFVIDEQCFQYATCAAFANYPSAGRAVFEVEYDLPTARFCATANRMDFNAVRLDVALAGGRQPCR